MPLDIIECGKTPGSTPSTAGITTIVVVPEAVPCLIGVFHVGEDCVVVGIVGCPLLTGDTLSSVIQCPSVVLPLWLLVDTTH